MEEIIKFINEQINYLETTLKRPHDNGYIKWAKGKLAGYKEILDKINKIGVEE